MIDEKYLRKENETIEEYQIRLSLLKLKEGEDIDWGEIQELLVNEGASKEHVDTLRRKGRGILLAHDVYEEKIQQLEEKFMKIKDGEEIVNKRKEEIQEKILELKVKRQQLRDERNYVNGQIREIARVDHLIQCVKDDIIELNHNKPLITEEIIDTIDTTDRDAVMLISDMHIGASCDGRDLVPNYNPDIAKDKFNYYINKCIERIKFEKPERIHMLFAGDIVSGLIHTTTRFNQRLDISEQVSFAFELISESIAKVRKECKVPVYVSILNGNHDRCVANKEENIEGENFVRILSKFVKIRFSDEKYKNKIIFYEQVEDSLLDFTIRGKRVCCTHGDKDKKNSIHRLIEINKVTYDYILLGHYHKFGIEEFNNTTIITNGAFGSETYSKNARLYNKAIQTLMFFTDDGLENIYPINLDNYNK